MSIYTNKMYEVLEHKNGMSKLYNLETGRIEDWNSNNNQHFVKDEYQLKINFVD